MYQCIISTFDTQHLCPARGQLEIERKSGGFYGAIVLT